MTYKLPSTVSGMGRCSVNMSALPHFLVSKLMKPTLPSLPGISSRQGDSPRPSAPSSARPILSSVNGEKLSSLVSPTASSTVLSVPTALSSDGQPGHTAPFLPSLATQSMVGHHCLVLLNTHITFYLSFTKSETTDRQSCKISSFSSKSWSSGQQNTNSLSICLVFAR